MLGGLRVNPHIKIYVSSFVSCLCVSEEKEFGLSKTEIGGIIGGHLFLVVAVVLAVVAVVCSRRRDRERRQTKYGMK